MLLKASDWSIFSNIKQNRTILKYNCVLVCDNRVCFTRFSPTITFTVLTKEGSEQDGVGLGIDTRTIGISIFRNI